MSTNLKEDVLNAVNSSQSTTAKTSCYGNYGWICPKCGAVMAPFASTCINCRGNQYNDITTNPLTDLQKELWKYSGTTGIAPEAYYESKPITYAEAHVADRKLN